MAFRIVLLLLVLQCVQLRFVSSTPCSDPRVNSTQCNKQDGTASRILNRPRPSSTKYGPLLTSLFSEDADVLFGDQEIVFPDSYELLIKSITPIEGTPKCADGLSLCEEIETYPYKRLKETLEKKEGHNEFFGVDEAPPEFANRIGEPDENFICASIDTTIFPKAGRNKNNKWKYIINQGENEGYIQGIRIEKCVKLNGPCNLVSDAPVGYVASCKQKYVLRRLLSTTESGQPAPDSFQIPSACCCSFKKDFSFLINFGRSVTPAVRPSR